MKSCCVCKNQLSLESFSKDSSRKDGHQPRCKTCAREANKPYKRPWSEADNAARRARYAADPQRSLDLRAAWVAAHPGMEAEYDRRKHLKRYALSEHDYNALFDAQGGVCAICRTPPKSSRRLAIDHDHSCCPDSRASCGQCIRGLLCTKCNSALGLLGDTPDLIFSAIEYLLGYYNVREVV